MPTLRKTNKPHNNSAVIAEFVEYARQKGFNLSVDDVQPDGEIHRCTLINGTKPDCSYKLHLDASPTGWLKNWRGGEFTWKPQHRAAANDAEVDREYESNRQRIAEKPAHERDRARLAKMLKAERIWREAESAETHPYLHRKGVDWEDVRVYRGDMKLAGVAVDGALVVPLRRPGNKDVVAVQLITPAGDKRFFGSTKGTRYRLRLLDQRADVHVIAEGLATALSLRDAVPRARVYAAMSAGNLAEVAKGVRDRYPNAEIVVAADNDHRTDGNPGLTAAVRAADAVAGLVAVPFLDRTPTEKQTDFNDLARIDANEVRRLIREARPPSAYPGFSDKTRLRILDWNEVLAFEAPSREAILGDWLTKQGIAQVFAERGLGKTMFSLSLALAVATGSEFLNWKVPKPCKVLYVDGEMASGAMQNRIRQIAAGFAKKPEPGYFRMINRDWLGDVSMPNLASVEGQSAIEVQLGDTDLIIFDNLSTLLLDKAGENDAASWDSFGAWLLRLRSQGRTSLFNHHTNKSKDQRGTSRKEDTLDVSIALRRPKDHDDSKGAQFVIEFTKSRHLATPKPIVAQAMQTNHGTVWKVSDVESTTRDKVFALLDDDPALKLDEIADRLGINRSSASRYRHDWLKRNREE